MELSSSTKNLGLHKPCTVILQLSKSGKSVEHALMERHYVDLSKIYREFCVKGEGIILLLPLKRRAELATVTPNPWILIGFLEQAVIHLLCCLLQAFDQINLVNA